MKVLHVIPGLGTGGAEISLFRLVEGIVEKGCESVVVSLTGPGDFGPRFEALGVRTICLGMTPGIPGPLGCYRLVRWIRQLRPDLIQGWMYHGNLAATVAQCLSRRKIPVLWNIRHSLDDLLREHRMLRTVIAAGKPMAASTSGVIYNSFRSARQHEIYGFPAAKTIVIPNGFDVLRFRPDLEKGRVMREALGIDPGALVIALVARFHPVKGHDLFLKAAASFSKKHPRVRFVLAGKGLDRGNHVIAEAIASNRLTSQIILAGERQDLPGFLNGIDLLTLTSSAESFPNILGEAMACGIPCVTTDVGDAAWLVGESGTVVPRRDPQAICDAWERFFTLEPQQKKKLGDLARERIEREFSSLAVTDRYWELYRQLSLPQEAS